jgi:CubicO group peptidase (beta-lactamase class C family)
MLSTAAAARRALVRSATSSHRVLARGSGVTAASPLLPSSVVDNLLSTYGVAGVSVAVLQPMKGDSVVRTLVGGVADKSSAPQTPVFDSTWFQIASLSKPIAAAFAHKYFAAAGIPMDAKVNPLLAEAGTDFRLKSAAGCPAEWADEVTLTHLVDHTGLGMHYVNGVPTTDPFPPVVDLMSGTAEKPAPYGYASLELTKRPGTAFSYSGGGFLCLQHLLEAREGKPIAQILDADLQEAGSGVSLGLSFAPSLSGKHYAVGYNDAGGAYAGGRLNFPPLAAGALGTTAALADWLRQLALAYKRPEGCGAVTHAAAVSMLKDRPDLGSYEFMKAKMGVGMFVFDVQSEGGGPPNRWMLHQAANDGYRGVLLICFDGPDAAQGPRGLVVICNGDNQGMLLNCAVSRALLASPAAFSPPLQGLDWDRVPSMDEGFSTEGMKQEEIVNLGLRGLVLNAFVDA